MTGESELASLLAARREELIAFVRRNAPGLLRFESPEDLVQGIHLRALERRTAFDFRGERAFLAFMYALARGHLADRRAHWAALKRGSSPLLRLTARPEETADPRAVGEAVATGTGPATFASRREEAALAVRALELLSPRDRDLVRWHADGVSVDEQAVRLGVTYAAAQRAGLRAVERFRKAFRVLGQTR